ncbi:MAG: HAMP domain-containing sensor histidine kinase [Clostridium sp.]|uniref:sensor histidine kinase n=1 Tax=Clostridium sp. TaxID=1506 RepID=UPI0039ED704E
MISYIKEEPLLKKLLLLLVGSILFMWVLIFFTHYYTVHKIYNERINFNRELIGSLTKLYPENETDIVKAVLNKDDNEKDLGYGEEILKKYGYDSTVTVWNDDNFNKEFKSFIINDFIMLLLLLVICTMLFSYFSLYFIKSLKKLSNNIDNITAGNYLFNIEDYGEGILSKISTQFYQMARRIDLSLIKLKEEKQNIKALVTDISHQIKTPLASIKLFNSLLIEDNNLNTRERNEFLMTIKSESAKLQWLVDSLIKLSRLEVGMIELKKENKSIKDTIYKAVEGVYSKALYKNINIIVNPIEENFICHDVKWTKEAIINVLENAVKYSYKNGEINISVAKLNSYIRIDIKDSGIGIAKEDFNKIFKRFFRGNSDLVQEEEGSGVGLYLSRKILEEQGGSIIVDSLLGKGSKFSLFLQKCK